MAISEGRGAAGQPSLGDGTAGLSVTAGSGGAIDIAYHSALMAVLLATGAVLWTGRTSSKSQSGLKEVNR